MSTLFVNNLNTASGTTITVPTGMKLIGTDSSTFKQPGMILQTAVAQSDSKITKYSTSWVDTGLFTLQFANNLQTGSKVLCRFNVSLGEAHNNAWGSATYFSIFENTELSSDGADDSSITAYLLKSIIIDNGSILIGHTSTQALHEVQAHNSSGFI